MDNEDIAWEVLRNKIEEQEKCLLKKIERIGYVSEGLCGEVKDKWFDVENFHRRQELRTYLFKLSTDVDDCIDHIQKIDDFSYILKTIMGED